KKYGAKRVLYSGGTDIRTVSVGSIGTRDRPTNVEDNVHGWYEVEVDSELAQVPLQLFQKGDYKGSLDDVGKKINEIFKSFGILDELKQRETLSYFGKVGDAARLESSNVPIVRNIAKMMADNMGLNTVLHIRDANLEVTPIAEHVENLMEFEAIKNEWRNTSDDVAQKMMTLPDAGREALSNVLFKEVLTGKFVGGDVLERRLTEPEIELYRHIRATLNGFLRGLRGAAILRIHNQLSNAVDPDRLSERIRKRREDIIRRAAKNQKKASPRLTGPVSPVEQYEAAKEILVEDLESRVTRMQVDIIAQFASEPEKVREKMQKAEARLRDEFEENIKAKDQLIIDINAEFDGLLKTPFF
ncbi:hypothetical protein LCGC14_3040170, partial [marine sediment metagenome]